MNDQLLTNLNFGTSCNKTLKAGTSKVKIKLKLRREEKRREIKRTKLKMKFRGDLQQHVFIYWFAKGLFSGEFYCIYMLA